jgi:hypothetical protein
MSLPKIEIVTPLKETEDFNVTVKTSDCASTSLSLLAREFTAAPSPPLLVLPIRKNGTTRFRLDPGHYVFGLSFENIDDEASVTIEVSTKQEPSTAPSPLDAPTAHRFEKGAYPFDVFV